MWPKVEKVGRVAVGHWPRAGGGESRRPQGVSNLVGRTKNPWPPIQRGQFLFGADRAAAKLPTVEQIIEKLRVAKIATGNGLTIPQAAHQIGFADLLLKYSCPESRKGI